jgi:hypothetical protein
LAIGNFYMVLLSVGVAVLVVLLIGLAIMKN